MWWSVERGVSFVVIPDLIRDPLRRRRHGPRIKSTIVPLRQVSGRSPAKAAVQGATKRRLPANALGPGFRRGAYTCSDGTTADQVRGDEIGEGAVRWRFPTLFHSASLCFGSSISSIFASRLKATKETVLRDASVSFVSLRTTPEPLKPQRTQIRCAHAGLLWLWGGAPTSILPVAKPWGGGPLAERWVEGRRRLRKSPSVSASRCHLPIASRQGGSDACIGAAFA